MHYSRERFNNISSFHCIIPENVSTTSVHFIALFPRTFQQHQFISLHYSRERFNNISSFHCIIPENVSTTSAYLFDKSDTMINKNPSLSPPQTPTTYIQLGSSSSTSPLYSDQSSTLFQYSFHSDSTITNNNSNSNNNMDNQHFQNLNSPESIVNRHSPSLDDNRSNGGGGYYTNDSSPVSEDDFQRSNSQSSLASTMSPHEYVDLRSPTRQETFFPQGHMFETFPGQFGGIFAAAASAENGLQSPVTHSHHMMSQQDLDIKSPLDVKLPTNSVHQQQQQNAQHFYSHDILPQGVPGGGGQLPSPNRGGGGGAMVPLGGGPSMTPFNQGYHNHNHHHRPYQQINDVFGPPATTKQDFYMQSPFYPGYPNYW